MKKEPEKPDSMILKRATQAVTNTDMLDQRDLRDKVMKMMNQIGLKRKRNRDKKIKENPIL